MYLVRLAAALLLAAAAALMGVGPAIADPGGEVTTETSTAITAESAGAEVAEPQQVGDADEQLRISAASSVVSAEAPCDPTTDPNGCIDDGEDLPCDPNLPGCPEDPPVCGDAPDLPPCEEEPPAPIDPCDIDPDGPGCGGEEEPPAPTNPCELNPEAPGCTDDDTGNTGGNPGNPGGNNGGNSGGNGGGITTGEGQPNTPPSAEGNGGPAVPTGIVPGLVERPVVATLSSCSDPALCQATEPEITPVAASTGPTLPATGAGESTPYVLVGGLALILVGGVMLRRGSGIASAPAGKHAAR